VHDFNGGVQPSGLFWLVELPPGAFNLTGNGRGAVLHARDLPVVDNFVFFGPGAVPATVSVDLRWEATGPAADRGRGPGVPPPTRRPSWASSPPPGRPAPAPGPGSGSPSGRTPGPAPTAATPRWGASATAASC